MRPRDLLGSLAFAIAVGGTSPPTRAGGPAPDAVEPAKPSRLAAVIVSAEDIDRDALADALALRAPDREVLAPGVERPSGLFAVAEIRQQSETTVGVVVILSDGRLYRRELDGTPDVAARVGASALEHLLAGIEEDKFVPDERDVPLPETATKPPPEPAPPEPTPTPPPPGPPPRELGVIGFGGVLIGLPPPSPSGFAGGGGGVELLVRWPSGLTFGGGLRVAGHRADSVAAIRTRAHLEVGYAYRRGGIELLVGGGPDIEPIVVRRDGAREVFTFPDGQTQQVAVGLGGHVRLGPAYRLDLGARGSLRIGPRVEIAGSGLGSGGVARLNTAEEDGTRTPVLRVGGLEVFAGLGLGGWVRLRR